MHSVEAPGAAHANTGVQDHCLSSSSESSLDSDSDSDSDSSLGVGAGAGASRGTSKVARSMGRDTPKYAVRRSLGPPVAPDPETLLRAQTQCEVALHRDTALPREMLEKVAKTRFEGGALDERKTKLWVVSLNMEPAPVPLFSRLRPEGRAIARSSVPGPIARQLLAFPAMAPLVVSLLEAVFSCPAVVEQWPGGGTSFAHLVVAWTRVQCSPAALCVNDLLPFSPTHTTRTLSGALVHLDTQVVRLMAPCDDPAAAYVVHVALAGATKAQATVVTTAWAAAAAELHASVKHAAPGSGPAPAPAPGPARPYASEGGVGCGPNSDAWVACGVAAVGAAVRVVTCGAPELGHPQSEVVPGVMVTRPVGPGATTLCFAPVAPTGVLSAAVSLATLVATGFASVSRDRSVPRPVLRTVKVGGAPATGVHDEDTEEPRAVYFPVPKWACWVHNGDRGTPGITLQFQFQARCPPPR